jgi:hypothetical protein
MTRVCARCLSDQLADWQMRGAPLDETQKAPSCLSPARMMLTGAYLQGS